MVEVYGEAAETGESGIERANRIEHVKRGHRLIADDAVEIRR
jgi:serine kinase of HPr protein (carbohydrate metabolism regulator)